MNRVKIIRSLAWAWLIIIGGLMITPGGINCIVCGPVLNNLISVISIALGALGLATERSENIANGNAVKS